MADRAVVNAEDMGAAAGKEAAKEAAKGADKAVGFDDLVAALDM
jgi:hypothetical protein